MQKITFEYKGTMIKVTNALKESFEYAEPISTVRNALLALNKRYSNKLDQFVNGDVSLILKKDGQPGVLINNDSSLDIELGDINTITFFYPFKGG